MIDLLALAPTTAERALLEFAERAGVPPYRARQVVRHLWQAPVSGFASMTDLPVDLRDRLAAAFSLPRLEIAERHVSADGTQKLLFRLSDGEAIETVLIRSGDRTTVCVSSQAGCALRCSFCATGAMGFARNLTAFEIAGQIRELALLDPPVRVTNVVFMGMGEPMMNWPAVDTALTILNAKQGLGIGARHITVSTVGVLPGILALAERPEQFRLALSIHAPSDALRQSLMPINTKYPLAAVVEAAKAFTRRVTFEYVMLAGVNDGADHLRQLAALARECGAFVNLIPLHTGGGGDFRGTSSVGIMAFARGLRGAGIEVAVRKSRGLDIAAACGQLRAERIRGRLPERADHHREVKVAR